VDADKKYRYYNALLCNTDVLPGP